MLTADTRVTHRGTPAEPYATPRQRGWLLRTTPSKGRLIPAQGYVDWGAFQTWEKLCDLR